MISAEPRVNQIHDVMQSIIWDIVDWIESDFSRKMNANVVAEKSGYSHWHFQRRFKLVTGYSPGYYIRARRMTIAAYLLKSTNLSITQIYDHVGIGDGATFCRIFQRHFGLTPTAYRDSDDDFSSRMLSSLRQ